MEVFVFAFVGWLIGKAYRDAQDRQEELHRSYLHEHAGGWGWHDHVHDGYHVHTQGMDGPFHYVPKREADPSPRRPSDEFVYVDDTSNEKKKRVTVANLFAYVNPNDTETRQALGLEPHNHGGIWHTHRCNEEQLHYHPEGRVDKVVYTEKGN